MGEATYYARLKYETRVEAEMAEPFVREFLEQAYQAYAFWQANRGKDMASERFWSEYNSKFPLVYKYMEELGFAGKDHDSSLAGVISVGDPGDEENLHYVKANAELRYHALVWHGADWNQWLGYISKVTGAKKCGYASDEDISPDEDYYYDHVEV